nr:hypothetical transcript [Hymenolepis microstoma]
MRYRTFWSARPYTQNTAQPFRIRRSATEIFEHRLYLTEKDLNKCCPYNVRNSLENLSYQEILRIVHENFKEAFEDIIRISHVMRNIREPEKLRRRLNMPRRIKSPDAISLNFHRKLFEMVVNAVSTDARLMQRNERRLRTPERLR